MATTAGALVAIALLPRLLGTTWRDVQGAVGHLGGPDVVGLLALWFAGLCCCSAVLTGSLPGLSHARALLLNLSGSAVSGAVPLGGALGVWLNTSMLRRWSFRGRDIASFTVTSNVVDVAGKLVFAVPALAVALAAGGVPQVHAAGGWAWALGAGGAVAVTAAALCCRDAGLRHLAAAAALAVRLRERLRPRPEPVALSRDAVAQRLADVRGRVGDRLRRAWPRLTAAVLGYVALQALLALVCLRLAGVALPVTTVLAAFALDRIASMLPVTPSGAGFAEAAACTVLLGAGGAAAPVLAGVLLYRLLLVVLEVPVGALALGGWLLAGRVPAAARRGRRP
nr:lysylphosphatidylglycerol synthase domain-containing protein [Kineococcus siccus]